jgi:hypothetical protein
MDQRLSVFRKSLALQEALLTFLFRCIAKPYKTLSANRTAAALTSVNRNGDLPATPAAKESGIVDVR